MSERRSMTTNVLLGAIVAFMIAFALYASRPVIVPLLFGLFLAVLMQPMVSRLSKVLPYWLSLIITVIIALSVAGGSAFLLVITVNDMVEQVPQYTDRFNRVIEGVLRFLKSKGVAVDPGELGAQQNLSSVLQFIGSSLSSVFDILGRILVVMALGLFALFEARGFRQKIHLAFGAQRSASILAVLEPMSAGVGRYLRTKTIISLFTGLVAYIICLSIGIDFAFMWGVLVFVLNFLPYIGPVIAVGPAVAVAFLQYDTPARGIILVIALGTSQVLSGIVIEPQIMGHSFRISPLFVLVSMLFWGWFWGLAGVVLAIPVSAAIVIACAHVDRLQPVAVMLGAVTNEGRSTSDRAAADSQRMSASK